MATTDEMMNKIGRSEDELFDYFSELPEPVIHHVLSFLPFNDIACTSVLSKAWNRIWNNYPNIDLTMFFQTDICTPLEFLNMVERILDRCLFHKDSIQKLNLNISFPYLEELSPNLDRWLQAAVERNVSEMDIKFPYLADGQYVLYSVPQEVVTSNSLKVLNLVGCMFRDTFACIALPHLQKFGIFECRFMGENVLNEFLSGCPELESLDMLYCEGIGGVLSVSFKPRFRYFNVFYSWVLERIEILAPNLEVFECNLGNPCIVDLNGCTSLKRLELDGAVLSTRYVPIQSLLSQQLYIEELHLTNCRLIGKIKLSSSCLKRLVINCSSFPGSENDFPNLHHMDFPNLLNLEFFVTGACNIENQFKSWNVPKLEDLHLSFSVKGFWTICRCGLKGFLKKLSNYEKLKLLIHYKGYQNMIIHEKLDAVSFSSLNTFVKRSKPETILISSRDDLDLPLRLLGSIYNRTSLSLICSSRKSIELMYETLRNNSLLQLWYGDFQLVSTEDVEGEMDSAWKTFMHKNSTGFHSALVILHKRPLEEMFP